MGEPSDESVEESDEGEHGNEVGDDVGNKGDGIARSCRRCVQRVRLLPETREKKGHCSRASVTVVDGESDCFALGNDW